MNYSNYKVPPILPIIPIEQEFDIITPYRAMPITHINDSVANEAYKQMIQKCSHNYKKFECEKAIQLYNAILKTKGYK